MSDISINLLSRDAKLLEKEVVQTGNREHRLSNLDGIRGIAIALVLIRHACDLLWPESLTQTIGYKVFWHVGMSLWVGVDLFFLLSGFLITSILIRTREAKNYYTGFYGRRVVRIMPMFFVVLLLACAFLLGKGQCSIWQCLFLVFSLGNWLIISNHEIGPLSHFWSLAVEEQFYLAWPVITKCLKPSRLVWLALGLFGSAALLRVVLALANVNPYVIYKITPTRWDGLALGAMLACLPACPDFEMIFLKHFRKLMIGSLVGLAAVVIHGRLGLYAFSKSSLALGLPFVEVLAMGLVFAALQSQKGTFATLLNSDILQWLGRYSYSIYLLHVPCLYLANWLSGASEVWLVKVLILIGVYLGVSLLLSRLAWDLVEQPFMNLRHKFKPVFPAPGQAKANSSPNSNFQ